VGAGGGFLLVPLFLVIIDVPIRVTIGSSLAIVAIAASSGFLGKLVTAQIRSPDARGRRGRDPGRAARCGREPVAVALRLRVALFVLLVLTTVRVWADLLGRKPCATAS